MSKLNSSWGLIIELGETPAIETTQFLYHYVWNLPETTGPLFKMGDYHDVFKAAEGGLTCDQQAGKCYTKFDQDTLGYPNNWQVPVCFQWSLFGFQENLAEQNQLYRYLLDHLQFLIKQIPVRMAMIGDLAAYYLNADFINSEWVDLQQESVLALVLPETHRLKQTIPTTSFDKNFKLFTQADLRQLWTETPVDERYKRFKEAISHEIHSPFLSLEWEH